MAIISGILLVAGFYSGYLAGLSSNNTADMVFDATVVKVDDRKFLRGGDRVIYREPNSRLREGDVHCVRIVYDNDGFASRVDVSDPGAKCSD